ncbi:MAG TPA: family 10 glycosylhydrolase [Candidatus Krumholzibacteria bacterium]|nr:family 10 glycosylhydrolase [Candidatus Krumholzibacteria bacterium]
MSRPVRAATRVAIVVAATWLLAGTHMEPLPLGGAPAFSQTDTSSVFTPPYLTRLAANTSILPNNEIRALWVVRDALTSPESITRLVDFATQTRFHILFVQVRGRGDAYYQSSLDPPAASLTAPLADFDPLRYLITLAHRNDIQVHAWLNVYYAWSDTRRAPPPEHLVVKHPDWILSNAQGTRMDHVPPSRWKAEHMEGYFLSPGVSEFREHMVAVVRELVNTYDIDGIHLDYIRYPNKEYTFDRSSRSRFLMQYGVDPVELAGNRATLEKVVGAGALASLDSLFSEERCAQVDSMVMDIHAACAGKPLSAAVVADPVLARSDKGQDWPTWVHKGWVDFVAPMAYSMPPLEVEARARVYNRLVGVEHVLIGLGVYDGRDQFLAESVGLLRDVPVAGYAIFSYNALLDMVDGASLIEEAVLPVDSTDADSTAADSTGTDDDDQ